MWGTIKKLTDRRFGFISFEDSPKDLFFHEESLVGVQFDELHEGDCINFKTEEGPRGTIAIEVQRNDKLKIEPALHLPVPVDPISIELVRALDDKLLRRLRQDPIAMRQLHPKVFEELVAEIYRNEGFETEIIGSWNQADGGIDIIAVRRELGGYPVRHVIHVQTILAEESCNCGPDSRARRGARSSSCPCGGSCHNQPFHKICEARGRSPSVENQS